MSTQNCDMKEIRASIAEFGGSQQRKIPCSLTAEKLLVEACRTGSRSEWAMQEQEATTQNSWETRKHFFIGIFRNCGVPDNSFYG